MATRSVRFDEETERSLQRLTRTTGLSISEILKRGVLAYEAVTLEQPPRRPWEVYQSLELGTGGWERASAAEAKAAVAEVIQRKHRR
jgi:hypothetical protein